MKLNRTKLTLLAASISLALVGCGGEGDDGKAGEQGATGAAGPQGEIGPSGSMAYYPLTIYADYPVTLDVETTEITSVSYSGQMHRHALRDQLKSVLSSSDLAQTTEADIIEHVNKYLKNTDNVIGTEAIIAPADKEGFEIKEVINNDLSSKSLTGSMVAGSASYADAISGVTEHDEVMGVPGTKTAEEVADMWVKNFAKNYAATQNPVDSTNGYHYGQLMAKFLMGAVFYKQGVDKYLDEYLDDKSNSTAYSDGKIYTGIEHSWDEGFGYFGAAANYGLLTPEQNYNVKKQKAAYFAYADWDGDGTVSLKTEYTSGPAYYAADADKNSGGQSMYGKNIMAGFLGGRELISEAVDSNGHARDLTAAEKATLKSYANTIQDNWEMVFAEGVYKYAGSMYNDIMAYEAAEDETAKSSALADYYKHFGEGKGLMLALQFGGSMSKMDKANFEEIDNLLGFGPVMADGSQVDGIDDETGYFTKSAAGTSSFETYKAALKEVQTKLDAFYSLKTKKNMIN